MGPRFIVSSDRLEKSGITATTLVYKASDITSGPRRFRFRKYRNENMLMQYTEIFKLVKVKIFSGIFFSYFFAQNVDCGYTLEPPRRVGSNEYTQSMFWIKNKNLGRLSHTKL